MFKQFIDKAAGSDIYLITSLWIFLIFFIIVGAMLFFSDKKHIAYMSQLPLIDENNSENEKNI